MDLINEAIYGHTVINPVYIRTYHSASLFKDVKQWVAEITGIDEKFGMKREFLKKQSAPYKVADFQEIHFILKSGKIYQYNNLYVAQGHFTSGFIGINANQTEILTLEKEEVRRLLRMPVKNWKVTAVTVLKSEDFNYADDEIPF